MFEGCSGGGGRYDLECFFTIIRRYIKYDTDAIERLKIRATGSSFAYPNRKQRISASPNHQTTRKIDLLRPGQPAMGGTLRYELDRNGFKDRAKYGKSSGEVFKI